jgi:hypothetical protein
MAASANGDAANTGCDVPVNGGLDDTRPNADQKFDELITVAEAEALAIIYKMGLAPEYVSTAQVHRLIWKSMYLLWGEFALLF